MTERRAFVAPNAIVWMLLFTLIAALAVAGATEGVKLFDDTTADEVQRALARIGADSAEDWLAMSFEGSPSPYVPRSAGLGDTVLERIAARHADGSAFEIDQELRERGVEVYVADTSFDIDAFSYADGAAVLPPYAMPRVPHEMPNADNGYRARYYYFIRSVASHEMTDYISAVEELIYFDVDAATGALVGAGRMFFRSRSE